MCNFPEGFICRHALCIRPRLEKVLIRAKQTCYISEDIPGVEGIISKPEDMLLAAAVQWSGSHIMQSPFCILLMDNRNHIDCIVFIHF